VRRVTIVVPYLASGPDRESGLRSLPSALQHVIEHATVVKLAPLAPSATPEAAFLAMNPVEAVVAQGPLTVAFLGHEPPEKSVHFHLTLCSVDETGVLSSVSDVQERAADFVSELDALFGAVARLKTPSLTPLRGAGLDHALVWENGSLEMHTATPSDAFGHDVFSVLPKGEGEELLRRFIDDSVNLLNTLESNHMRREEGLPSLNCLWPWGQGFRPDLPNLPLRRGDVVHVVSGSMRMQGLCRLVGYSHGDRHAFGTKLQTNYDMVRENASAHRLSLAVIHSIEEMQRHGRTDEIAWNLEQLSTKVVSPLIEAEEPFELRLAAPGGHCSVGSAPEGSSSTGLMLTYVSDRRANNTVPFDERVFDDVRVPTANVWEFLHPGFLGLE
jgi:2,3-bisphosphoglycerate-independent phosphoglycerate mutase